MTDGPTSNENRGELRELEIIFAALALRFGVLSGEDEKRYGGGGLIDRTAQVTGAITTE
jgi:hypothetical protein